jgi:hypothetical protein
LFFNLTLLFIGDLNITNTLLNIKSCQDTINWILTNRLLIKDHNVIVIDTKISLIAGAFGINSTIWPINTKGIVLINFDYLYQQQSTTVYRKRDSIYSCSRNSAYL